MAIGKIISVIILILLIIWECVILYFVYGVTSLVEGVGTPLERSEFIIFTHPLLWVYLILTIGLIIDIVRREKILILNTVLLISIVTVSNIFLTILVVLAG